PRHSRLWPLARRAGARVDAHRGEPLPGAVPRRASRHAHISAEQLSAGQLSSGHRKGGTMSPHWPMPSGLHTTSVRLPVEGDLPSFGGATGWLNTKPLTAADLSGRVVVVNFWTYTCINWLRQLPYVRAWAEKYTGEGLVMIGVHTPEFGFESNVDN